jgi:hypothetical protein
MGYRERPMVTVHFDEYVKTPGKNAALFKNVVDEKNKTDFWVPLSQIEDIDDSGASVKVKMTQWWAEKEGYI